MTQTANVLVNPEDRARLATILEDRNRPLKHIQRTKIVLSAEHLPVLEVVARDRHQPMRPCNGSG